MNNRTFGGFIVIAWLVLLLSEPIADEWDDMTTPQPWFDAEISLTDIGSIDYYREVSRWMRGEWTAVVQVANGDTWQGHCIGTGRFTYRPIISGSTYLPFAYFTGGCEQPTVRHRVCVDYVMQDRRGRQRDFGPYCTDD